MKNFFALVYLVHMCFSHKCIHSHIIEKIGKPKIMEEPLISKIISIKNKARNLQEKWRPINLFFDYSNITDTSPKTKKHIEEIIMPLLKKNLKALIKVKGSTLISPFTHLCEDEILIPKKYNNILNADLIIFVRVINEKSGFLAYAATCSIKKSDNRPVTGMIMINERNLKFEKEDIDDLYATLLHESMHIFAISPILFDTYLTKLPKTNIIQKRNSNIGNRYVKKLITPKLIKAAQEHFNCNKIDGVFLENEGSNASAGAHFEKVYFGNELMTSQKTGFSILSKMTLALLEDSGWYQIDFGKTEELFWGRGKGCAFMEAMCDIEFEEYCVVEHERNCSIEYRGKTFCAKTNFGDKCFTNEYSKYYMCDNRHSFKKTALYEEVGAFSRCLKVYSQNRNTSGCYVTKCNLGKIEVSVNGKIYYCENNNDIIQVNDDFAFFCPDVEDFCGKMEKGCEEDCNGNGFCLSNSTCACKYWFEGDTCKDKRDCQLDDSCEKVEEPKKKEEEEVETKKEVEGDTHNKNINEDKNDNDTPVFNRKKIFLILNLALIFMIS